MKTLEVFPSILGVKAEQSDYCVWAESGPAQNRFERIEEAHSAPLSCPRCPSHHHYHYHEHNPTLLMVQLNSSAIKLSLSGSILNSIESSLHKMFVIPPPAHHHHHHHHDPYFDCQKEGFFLLLPCFPSPNLTLAHLLNLVDWLDSFWEHFHSSFHFFSNFFMLYKYFICNFSGASYSKSNEWISLSVEQQKLNDGFWVFSFSCTAEYILTHFLLFFSSSRVFDCLLTHCRREKRGDESLLVQWRSWCRRDVESLQAQPRMHRSSNCKEVLIESTH